MTKIISVFGSTGAQGGAVVRALLKSNEFKVRALTRNLETKESQHLKSLGCEVVKCDVVDSQQDIENALKDSYGVFLVTVSYVVFDYEAIYGKKVADAALNVGVKHFVFSSLPPSKKLTNGKIEISEFDLKYEVEEYLKQLSKNNSQFISTFVIPPFYMQNFDQDKPLFSIKKNDDGTGNYYLDIAVDPNAKYPFDLVDIDDIGPVVAQVLKDPKKYSGVSILLNGDTLRPDEICEILSKQTGKPIKLHYIPPNEYKKVADPDVAKMLDFCNNYGLEYDNIDRSLASRITKLTTFSEYLKKNSIHLK